MKWKNGKFISGDPNSFGVQKLIHYELQYQRTHQDKESVASN